MFERVEAVKAESITKAFTPKDFDLVQIMNVIATLLDDREKL